MMIWSWLLFAVLWMSSVLCEICDVSDQDCTTKGANNSFASFINGIADIVDTSDPLWRDEIICDTSSAKYTLTNASLSGMRDCLVTKLKVDKNEKQFNFHLECPHIAMNANYKMKGTIADFAVEGDGTCTVTCHDYVFKIYGVYETSIGEDNKPHVQIKSYKVDADARGHVWFDFRNLYGGNKEKSKTIHKFVNEHWRSIDKELRTPPITGLLGVFIDNLNAFLKFVPIGTVLQIN